jgi:hypothetical protein
VSENRSLTGLVVRDAHAVRRAVAGLDLDKGLFEGYETRIDCHRHCEAVMAMQALAY